MGLFSSKKSAGDAAPGPNSRRPPNTAFKQQRLKAWQPILTPKTVIPSLFLVGIIFGPIGAALILGSAGTSQITLDYTDCDALTASTTNGSYTFTPLPPGKFNYDLSKGRKPSSNPRYALLDNSQNSSMSAEYSAQMQCILEFNLPAALSSSVFLYYKLTGFYQNERRYAKSFHVKQFRGERVSSADLAKSDCKDLASVDTPNGKKVIFPCGLIANSVFNDTFSSVIMTNGQAGVSTEYTFTQQGIAWPGEKDKYKASPIKGEKGNEKGYANMSEIVPPPNWHRRFPGGVYTPEHPPPNLQDDPLFQNWMRTAGLPTFSKLYGRNDTQVMQPGEYRIVIGMNYPVKSFKGTKSIVIATTSWIGGKNPFMGWAYVVTASLFVALGIAATVRHLVKPRRLGDMSYLAWNQ